MKVTRKMRKLDDLYDTDCDSGTDSSPIHSPTPKSCKLVTEQVFKKRRRKPMDSDSDSDADVPEKNVGNYDSRADRCNQPKSSLNATQPIVVPAGTDVMFSLMSALSDSPRAQQTAALLTASMLHSSHSIALTNSEGLSAVQNIDEVPCSNQEDANSKSVAELPYVKPFRERSKMCLGDLLEKRQYQKSPIILRLGASNSPGVKTPIITSSSSSSLTRNNVTDNTANGNCVRLEADDDDWMEDVCPVESSNSPVRKRKKNAKDNKITKTKENKSKKKDNGNVVKKTDIEDKKANDENLRNNGVKREDYSDKKEDRLNDMKDSVTAAPSDDYVYDVPVTTPRPLLMPLIPLNTLPPIPVLAPVLVLLPGTPVLTISPSTATTNTPTTCTRISAVVLTTEPEPEQAQNPVGLMSSPNASRRNLPKCLVPKESDLTAASNIIRKIKNSKLLHELDAALRLKELPSLLKSDVEVSVLNTPSKPSRRIDILNDVTGYCSSNVKKMNLEEIDGKCSLGDSYFNDVCVSAIIDADDFIRNKTLAVPMFEVTVQESLLRGDIKALAESHSNVTDTYLRNLESSRLRHEVLTNDKINPFGDCKDKIEKLKDNSDGSDDDSDDSDDDVIVL